MYYFKTILFCFILIVQALACYAQFLSNMAVYTSVDAGFIQQKINFGYQMSIRNYSLKNEKDIKRQLIIGVGIGMQNYNTFHALNLNSEFITHAQGYNCSFSILNGVTQPKYWDTKKFESHNVGLRIGINNFNTINAYYQIFNGNGLTGYKDKVKEAKCTSVDFEIMINRLYKLNTSNYISLGMNAGIRIGSISGIRINDRELITNEIRFKENLSPYILNFSLGYQFQFGPN